MNKNLNELIKILEQKKNDYYLISTYDEYLFEYVSEKNMRLKWLTNFSGTNGIALISKKKKYFFTDGRYLLQAKKELSKQFELIDMTAINFLAFVKAKIYKSKILVDFKLFKTDFIRKLKKIADSNQNSISHDCANIIDKIWKKRPKELKKNLFFVDKSISGETLNDKKRKLFHNNKYDYFIITSSDSICWLLNIRGYDLPHTPIVFSKLVVSKKIIKLFIDPEKLPKKEIKLKGVQIYSENEFQNEIYKISKKATILLDKSTSYFYYDFLSSKGFKFDLATEPCANLKCQKNTVEILNAKKAHQKDGLSLVKFFYWLEKNSKKILLNKDTKAIAKAIDWSCKIKRYYVVKDHNEKDFRKILNFGHTVAHAIEAGRNYSNFTGHGEAVLIGMILETQLSYRKKICSIETLKRIQKIYLDNNLKKYLKLDFFFKDIKKTIKFMENDKKNDDNRINFILLKDIGKTTLPGKIKFEKKDLIKEFNKLKNFNF